MKPSLIGLRQDQMKNLSALSKKVPASKIIYSAVERYKKGEILIQKQEKQKHQKSVLVSFPIRKRPPYSDSVIRSILDAHFAKPIDMSKEIANLDREINSMIGILSQTEYIKENEQ